MLLTEAWRLFPDNKWQRLVLTWRDGVPVGFAEDANASLVSLRWVHLFFLPPLLLVLLLLLNGVCCRTKWEDWHCGLPQLRQSGLETMGILGGSDATQRLFEERADASQESTFSHIHFCLALEMSCSVRACEELLRKQ